MNAADVLVLRENKLVISQWINMVSSSEQTRICNRRQLFCSYWDSTLVPVGIYRQHEMPVIYSYTSY